MPTTVTPSNQQAITYDEESWKPKPEDSSSKEKSPVPSTPSSSSKSSKAKKVKKYLKKCKNVLGSSKASTSFDCETASQLSAQSSASSSWYVDSKLDDLIQNGKVNEIEEAFDDVQPLKVEPPVQWQVANIIQLKGPQDDDKSENEADKGSDLRQESEDACSKSSASVENFHSAISSASSETLKSDDCEFFSLDSKNQERDETDYTHKQNVIESYFNSIVSEIQETRTSFNSDNTRKLNSEFGTLELNELNDPELSISPVLEKAQEQVDDANNEESATNYPVSHHL
ncbi:hypothetical protein HUJ04_000737 [Dendroctonus ponderosae]|nr:hypothetical protein HUJ04_000737 [Dendroctonus ponderosae]